MRECRLLELINWVRNYIKVKRRNGELNTYLTKNYYVCSYKKFDAYITCFVPKLFKRIS